MMDVVLHADVKTPPTIIISVQTDVQNMTMYHQHVPLLLIPRTQVAVEYLNVREPAPEFRASPVHSLDMDVHQASAQQVWPRLDTEVLVCTRDKSTNKESRGKMDVIMNVNVPMLPRECTNVQKDARGLPPYQMDVSSPRIQMTLVARY